MIPPLYQVTYADDNDESHVILVAAPDMKDAADLVRKTRGKVTDMHIEEWADGKPD